MYLGQVQEEPLPMLRPIDTQTDTLVVNVSDIPIYEPPQLPSTLPVSVPAPPIAPPAMAVSFPWWLLVLLGLAFLVKTKKG